MKTFLRWSTLPLCLAATLCTQAASVLLVPTNSTWRYLDDGSNQGTAWRGDTFSDAAWKSGAAELGYGDGDERTVVSFGPNSSSKYITTYFRRTFSVAGASSFTSLNLRLIRDDGAVVYLNGTEVFRSNMPTGTVSYLTLAPTAASDDGDTYQLASIPTYLLRDGNNVLAVEMHQNAGSSSDLSFDLELTGSQPDHVITLSAPASGATGTVLSPWLEVIASDANNDPLTVTFHGRPAGPPAGPDFTIVALPDTQYYVSSKNGGLPAMFYAQTDWVLNQRNARNIAFVTQLGDCVENPDVLNEWLVATNALYRLEDPLRSFLPEGVPYGVAVGNHDQSPMGNADGGSMYYNQFFGEEHFAGRAYYGGHYGTNNDNHFQLFSASGLDFIVVHLEFNTNGTAGPVLNWANNLLQQHSNRRAIVVTHWMLNLNGTFSAQGQAIYNALRTNSNLFMLLGGHITDEARREDTFNGNKVYTLLSDYQGRAGGGNGLLRLMEFSPSNNVIRVKTFSPYANVWETDANSQFELPYNMQPAGAPFALIGSQTIASGTAASVRWPNLTPHTAYEWYVTVSDGVTTTTSPAWRFTTGGGAPMPPTVSIAAPTHDSYFSAPADIVVNASAADADGNVTLVEFFAGATKIGEDASAPFSITWPGVTEGSYALTAVAHDDSGMTTQSAPVTVNVIVGPVPNTPPTANITAPANNASFTAPANIVVTATAADADGTVAQVEFYQGTTKIGESFSSPYSITWGGVAAGAYVLRAVATDNLGDRGTSALVNVTVLTPNETAIITRGPYLQMGTHTGMVVRWRTDVPTQTRLRYGTNPANLNLLFTDAANVVDHVAHVTGLAPNTKYFYEMGTALGWYAPDANDFFTTSPTPGTRKATRVWILGDSGTADNNARNVRNAYLNYTGARGTDLVLMLGDNAYNNGTDAEYGRAVFDMYPTVLQNTPLWPTIGNHDTAGSVNPSPSLPYFQMFTLPANAQAGGVASGTEKYYSFDYANIHFICLDSMSSTRTAGSPMLNWLEADLASTTQEWIIAFFHHPPYSKGSHNSDTETELMQMRAEVLPVLEAGGVDMVFAGHSHSYERSFLLDGHYGLSSTLSQDMKRNAGSGRVNSPDGAYQKPAGLSSHNGAVYTVAGASGKLEGGTLNHPAMFYSANVLGSVVLDISSNRIDALYLTTNGVALDHFTILKAVPPSPIPNAPSALIASALSSSQMELRWTDNSGNETGFELERSTDGINFTPLSAVGANVVNGVDVGLSAATLYYYRVRAFNDAGASAWSPVASATTTGPVLPPAPTGLTASPGDQLVVLNWDAAPNASTYNIWRSTTAGGPYNQVAYGVVPATYSDLGLVNGTTYFYVVSAVGESGEGPRSAETNATPNVPPPAIPTALTAVSGDGRVTLRWEAAAGASSYDVRRGDVSGGPYTSLDFVPVPQTNFIDLTAVNGTTYFYVVAALNGGGESSNSVEVIGAPAVTPAVPENFFGFAGHDSVLLTWDAAANATAYRLQRAVENGPFEPLAVVSTTSYTDTSVTNGLAYSYILSALNGFVEGAPTYDVVVIPVPPPPAAPTGPSAIAGDSQVTLTWNASTGATVYYVKRALTSGGSFAVIATTGAPGFTDASVNNGTMYFYVVSAANEGGESPNSSEVSATPMAPPIAPSGLSATATSATQINLSWTDHADNEAGCEVEQSTNGVNFTLLATLAPNASAASVTELTPATTYHYRVRAVNGAGASSYSEIASATTFDVPPGAPANFSATTTGATTIQLAWADTAANESGYVVEQSTDGVNFTTLANLPANSASHSVGSLAPAMTYFFRVRAFNAFGDSANVQASAMTLPLAPGVPTGLTAIAGNTIVSIAWEASAGASSYRVKRGTSASGPFTVIATVTMTSHPDITVANGTTYFYVVSAVNSGGESADSSVVSATPQAPPNAPSGVVVTFVSTSQLDLTWTDHSANEDGFAIERKTGAGGVWSEITRVGPGVRNFSDNGLTADTTYSYRLRSFNVGGFSAYSAEASGVTTRPWTVITYDAFETNFGSYTDGGSDCSRYTSTTHAHQGRAAANIQSRSSSSHFVTTTGRNVSGYGQLRVSFWYKAVSMETGEDFFLEYSSNGGSTWQVVQRWVSGTDFANNQFLQATVFINPGTFAFTSNVKLRFRCDASASNDDVYIDEIEWAGQ